MFRQKYSFTGDWISKRREEVETGGSLFFRKIVYYTIQLSPEGEVNRTQLFTLLTLSIIG